MLDDLENPESNFMNPLEDDKDDKASKKYLATIRDIGFLTAVYMYFIGWVYMSTYLGYFNLSLQEADIDFYNLITYSFKVFEFLFGVHIILTIVGLAMTIMIAYFFKTYFIKPKRKFFIFFYRESIYFILPFWFILLFVLARSAAYYDSRVDRIENKSQLRGVIFSFKKKDKDVDAGKDVDTHETQQYLTTELLSSNNKRKLRLLLTNKESYFVVMKDTSIHNESDAAYKIPSVFIVKKENVELAQLIY